MGCFTRNICTVEDYNVNYKLRDLRKEDMATINEWRNDPALIENLCAPFRFINPKTDENWFDNYMSAKRNSVRCGIVECESERLIGCVYLLNIDWVARCADLGIMIGNPLDRGLGGGEYMP